jgi:hypothetical protein
LVLNTYTTILLITTLLLSILITCPAQPNLFILIYLTMSGSLNSSYSSWFYLFLHTPFSCTAPKMHLNILLSDTLNNLSSVFDIVQVSDAYVSTGLKCFVHHWFGFSWYQVRLQTFSKSMETSVCW